MTLTAERSIRNAWTGDISPDPFWPLYDLGVDTEAGYVQHISPVNINVILDPSTGMVESIRVRMGISAAIPTEEDWEQVEPEFYLLCADSGTNPATILVDFPEPEGASDTELGVYHEVIEQLRSGGRELVAEELVELPPQHPGGHRG